MSKCGCFAYLFCVCLVLLPGRLFSFHLSAMSHDHLDTPTLLPNSAYSTAQITQLTPPPGNQPIITMLPPPLKSTCPIPPTATGENAHGAITSCLPDLDIGIEGVETTSYNNLRFTYIGHLAYWESFYEELSRFYFSKQLRSAFERTENLPLGLSPGWSATSYGIGEKEPVQTSDEITMSGRFDAHVVSKVYHVISALSNPQLHSPEELAELTFTLREDIKIGSAKCVPVHQRPKNEPDKVVKIPGTGNDQEVRLIGELKSPSTYKMYEHQDEPQKYDAKSFKNLFGMCPHNPFQTPRRWLNNAYRSSC